MARPPQAEMPDRTFSFSEAEKLRDRMNADEDKSTETLSTISRSIAVGLALITYTFFVQKEHNEFLDHNFGGLLVASVFGVLALTADTLHYLFGSLQVRLLRNKIEQHVASSGTLTIASLDHLTNNVFHKLRDAMFWSKLILVALGTSIVIVIILRVIWQ